MLSLHYNGHFSRCTSVSRYQNISILDFIGAEDDGGITIVLHCQSNEATVYRTLSAYLDTSAVLFITSHVSICLMQPVIGSLHFSLCAVSTSEETVSEEVHGL